MLRRHATTLHVPRRHATTLHVHRIGFLQVTLESLTAAYGAASSLVPLFKTFGVGSTQTAADAVHERKISLKDGLKGASDLLPRKCFATFRARAMEAMQKKENTALCVYGPRGCGKSTEVAAALQVSSVETV